MEPSAISMSLASHPSVWLEDPTLSMRRDPDLVRKLLFYFEEKPDFGLVKPEDIEIPGYEPYLIAYHVHLMCEAGFLSCERITSKTTADRLIRAYPFRLTWEGHEFLDAARNESVWTKAKEAIKNKFSSIPFSVLQALLISLSKAQLGLN
jgi:hypothetical protein